jgi:acetamidase/formamidase
MLQVHYLSGPIDVTGAQPGDLLVVEICEIQPLPGLYMLYILL